MLKKWKKYWKDNYIWKARHPGFFFDFNKRFLLHSTRFLRDYLYFQKRISKDVDFRILKHQKLYFFLMIQSSVINCRACLWQGSLFSSIYLLLTYYFLIKHQPIWNILTKLQFGSIIIAILKYGYSIYMTILVWAIQK